MIAHSSKLIPIVGWKLKSRIKGSRYISSMTMDFTTIEESAYFDKFFSLK
jgi:hypothetical protein